MHRSIMISFAFLDQLFYLLICLLICLPSCPSDCLLIPACIPTCINMCIAIVHTDIHTNSYSNISNNLPTYSTTDYLFLWTHYTYLPIYMPSNAYFYCTVCLLRCLSLCLFFCLSASKAACLPARNDHLSVAHTSAFRQWRRRWRTPLL